MKNLALRFGLVLSLLLTLVTVSAGATEVQIPDAPARPDHSSHDDWKAVSTTAAITGSGSYYLADDADFTQMTEALRVGAGGTTINLCLNGHTLKWASDKVAQGQYTLNISGGTVNICDCSETPGGLVAGRKAGTNGEADAGVNAYALGVPGSTTCNWFDASISNSFGRFGVVYLGTNGSGKAATFNFVSGTISNNDLYGNGVIQVNEKSTFNMWADAKLMNNNKYSAVIVDGSGSVFNMYGGTISGNSATGNGGAVLIRNSNTFNMYAGTISENAAGSRTAAAGTASGGTEKNGGGVYVQKGTFNMYGGTIRNNTALDRGAGVCVADGTFNMSGTATITENSPTATSNTGIGGGVCVQKGTFNMSGGTISNNTARHAGGVYTTVAVNMSGNATITGNTGQFYGGGMYSAGGVVKMSGNATISSNTTTGSVSSYTGAGLFVSNKGSLTMNDNAAITGNIAKAGYGAGVCFDNATLTMDGNASISDNVSTTKEGGGVAMKSGTFNMNGGKITGNSAKNGAAAGGGVYVVGGSACTFNMSGGEISGNVAKEGGGVYLLNNNCTFKMSGGTIKNHTTSGSGAGVYAHTGSNFEMTGGSITGNTANSGGGLYVNGTAEIDGGSICGNTITSWCGHDVAVFLNGSVTMKSGTIGQNNQTASIGLHAGKAPDGVYMPTFTMDGGTFDGKFTYSVVSAAQGSEAAVNIYLNGGIYSNVFSPGNVAKDCYLTVAEGKEFKKFEGMYLLAAAFEHQNNMKLGETLDVIFRIPANGSEAIRAYATIEGKGTTPVEFTKERDEYVITVPGVAAAEMTKKITVALKDAKGDVINVETDSIRDYGLRVLEDKSLSTSHAVVADMLHYGAAAQKYFSRTEVSEEKLADYGVTLYGADGAAILAESKSEIENISFAHSRAYSYANLTLDNMVDFNLYFWVDQIGEENKSYTYSINDGETVSGTFSQYLDATNEIGDPVLYALKVEGLTIADLAKAEVTVNFYEKGQAKTVTDTVYNYLARTDEKSKWSENGRDSSGLAKALMAFAESGNSFAGVAKPGDNETPIG